MEGGDLLSDGDIQGGREGGREVRRGEGREEIHHKMYTSVVQGPPGTPGRNGVDGLPGLRGPKGMDVSGYLASNTLLYFIIRVPQKWLLLNRPIRLQYV